MDSRFFPRQNGHVLRILGVAADSPGFDLIIRDRGSHSLGAKIGTLRDVHFFLWKQMIDLRFWSSLWSIDSG